MTGLTVPLSSALLPNYEGPSHDTKTDSWAGRTSPIRPSAVKAVLPPRTRVRHHAYLVIDHGRGDGPLDGPTGDALLVGDAGRREGVER